MSSQRKRVFPTSDEYHASLAYMTSLRSPEEVKQGACLINGNRQVIALAYNGPPAGKDSKEVISAAKNVIKYKTGAISGECTLYLTYRPNEDDLKVFKEAGIKKGFICLRSVDNSERNQDTSDSNQEKKYAFFEVRTFEFDYVKRTNNSVTINYTWDSQV